MGAALTALNLDLDVLNLDVQPIKLGKWFSKEEKKPEKLSEKMLKEIEFKELDENFEVIDEEEYYPEEPAVDEKEEKKFAAIKDYINEET